MKNFLRIAMTMTLVGALASAASAGDDKAPGKPAPVKADKPVTTPADKAPAADAMAMPTAPAEVAAAAKMMSGTWKCKGQAFKPDGTGMPMVSTMKMKADLDSFWMHGSFAETGKKKGAYKFESFSTFDGGAKKWNRLMVDNMGGTETVTADAAADGKMTWEGSSKSHMGSAKVRHHEEMAGKEMKLWGEWSMDGKSWTKGYEASCKK